MTKRGWLSTVAAMLLTAGVLVSVRLYADSPTTAPSTQPSAKAVNSRCPISGKPVDATVATYVYDGKTIGFCCPGCEDEFKKDPAKYMKDLK